MEWYFSGWEHFHEFFERPNLEHLCTTFRPHWVCPNYKNFWKIYFVNRQNPKNVVLEEAVLMKALKAKINVFRIFFQWSQWSWAKKKFQKTLIFRLWWHHATIPTHIFYYTNFAFVVQMWSYQKIFLISIYANPNLFFIHM